MLVRDRQAILLPLLMALACSRNAATNKSSDASVDGALLSIGPDAATLTRDPVSAPDGGFTLATVAPVEARRAHIQRFSEDAALEGATELLQKHFGGEARSGLDLQTADLTAASRRIVFAIEAGKPTTEARPLAFVAEGKAIVWSKERPVAGIMPPVGPIAVAPAPLGRVALAACDLPTNVVALRIWDDDGSPFADFQALTVEGCDALSLLYWPRFGWIVVTARVGATRAQLISENGTPKWGQGLDLGARSRPGAVAAASVAADTDDTFVLVQMVQPEASPGSPFHALAFRYDARGTPIWPAAVDLGELTRPPAPGERVKLALTRPGVRVTLPGGTEVDVRPSGDVSPRRRAPR